MTLFQNAKVIAENVSYAEYAMQTCERGDRGFVMSRGELMLFAECPHRWRAGFFQGDTKATEWGSLIDCLALQPARFDDLFAVAPETYPDSKTGEKKDWNWNATFCKEWRKEQGGRRVIKSDAFKSAQTAVKRLHAIPQVYELLTNSKKQVMATAVYVDRETGLSIPVRTLSDSIPNASKSLVDLKTAQSANPHTWGRAVFEHDYDAQAALNLDVYVAATGEDRCDFIHVVQENFEPYEVAYPLPSLSSEFIEIGRRKIEHALRLYARCLKTNTWPSYDPGTRRSYGSQYFVEPEQWMESRILESSLPPLSLPKIEPLNMNLAELNKCDVIP